MVNEMTKDRICEVKKAELIKRVHARLFPFEEIRGILESARFMGVETPRKKVTPWNAVVALKPSA